MAKQWLNNGRTMVEQWSNNGRTGLFDGLSVLKSVYYFDFCIFFQFFALKRPIFVYFSLYGGQKNPV
jgi:hypothetical protein